MQNIASLLMTIVSTGPQFSFFFGSETLVFAVGNPWEDVRPPLQSIWTS